MQILYGLSFKNMLPKDANPEASGWKRPGKAYYRFEQRWIWHVVEKWGHGGALPHPPLLGADSLADGRRGRLGKMSGRSDRLGRICMALAVLLAWSGCSALNFNTTLVVKNMLKTQAERDSSLDEEVNWRETEPDGVELSTTSPTISSDGASLNYLKSTLSSPERNPLKWLDAGAMVGGAWFMGKGIQHEANGWDQRSLLCSSAPAFSQHSLPAWA